MKQSTIIWVTLLLVLATPFILQVVAKTGDIIIGNSTWNETYSPNLYLNATGSYSTSEPSSCSVDGGDTNLNYICQVVRKNGKDEIQLTVYSKDTLNNIAQEDITHSEQDDVSHNSGGGGGAEIVMPTDNTQALAEEQAAYLQSQLDEKRKTQNIMIIGGLIGLAIYFFIFKKKKRTDSLSDWNDKWKSPELDKKLSQDLFADEIISNPVTYKPAVSLKSDEEEKIEIRQKIQKHYDEVL